MALKYIKYKLEISYKLPEIKDLTISHDANVVQCSTPTAGPVGDTCTASVFAAGLVCTVKVKCCCTSHSTPSCSNHRFMAVSF